tara:strand:- start:85 stop:243 length:159 start_codon:yes stop_codon:yes gene_type:complete
MVEVAAYSWGFGPLRGPRWRAVYKYALTFQPSGIPIPSQGGITYVEYNKNID